MNGVQPGNRFDNFGLSPLPQKGGLGIVAKILIVLALAAVAGAGTLLILLGTRVWDPLWNPFRPEPEEVISGISQKITETKISSINSSAQFELADQKTGDKLTMFVAINCDTDNTEPQNIKSTGDFNLEFDNYKYGKAALTAEFKGLEGDFYFKIKNLDLSDEFNIFLMMSGFNKEKIENQWIKIDKEDLLKGTGDEKQFTEDQRENLMKIFKEKKIYIVKKELSDEKIDGKKAYHYLVSFDRDTLEESFSKLFETSINSSQDSIGSEMFFIETMAKGMLSQVAKFLSELDINLWVGKKDNFFEIKSIKVTELGSSGSGQKLSFTFDFKFSEFKEPIGVGAPKEYKRIKEIIPEIPTMQPIPSAPINLKLKSSIFDAFSNLLKVKVR